MRAVNSAAQAQREQRAALMEIPMLWVEARNRASGAAESVGLWAGADTENITVTDMWSGNGVTRTFIGVGTLLGVGPVRWEAGFSIRPLRLSLAANSPAVAEAVRGYDVRGARAQVWRRIYDPASMLPIGIEPMFRGYVDRAPIPRAVAGGEAVIEMELVSTARTLTIASDRKRSDANQRRRGGDRFLRYAASAAQWEVPWGTK